MDAEETKKRRKGRPRNKRIEVWVTPEEQIKIASLAEQVGMTQSAFLRAAGQNQPIRSLIDIQAVVDLVKVNGDLGRVAGLLKLWLAEKRQSVRPADVNAVIIEFRNLQKEIREISGRVLRDR